MEKSVRTEDLNFGWLISKILLYTPLAISTIDLTSFQKYITMHTRWTGVFSDKTYPYHPNKTGEKGSDRHDTSYL